MRRASYSTVFLAVALTACASGGGSGEGSSSSSSGGNRNLITADELVTSSAENAYDAIQQLRSSWLRSRSGGAPAPFIDGQPQGDDINRLRSVSTSTITEIRYLSPSDATTAYGTGFLAGIIDVRTR